MLQENKLWKKAIAGTLSILTLVAGTGGLVSCGFGGEQEGTEERENENENQEGESREKEDDD